MNAAGFTKNAYIYSNEKKNHSRNVAYICLNENVISGEKILGLYIRQHMDNITKT